MSTAKLLAPVGAGERLGSATFKFSGNPSGGFFGSADSGPIPKLGVKSWFILQDSKILSNTGNISDFNFWTNSSNYLQGFRASGDLTYRMRFRIDNVEVVSVSVAQGTLSSHAPIIRYRNGNTWGIATYTVNADRTITLKKNEVTVSLGTADKFDANIGNHVSGRMYFGHYDGATAASKYFGVLGSMHIAVCGVGETLADYGITSDDDLLQLLLDHQRIFSHCGFAASQVRSFGDWCDSSGNRKYVTKESQLASGDRLVDPFSGTYLTLATGAASANALAYPPYTPPGNTPNNASRGSRSQLDNPPAVEVPDGWVVALNYVDQSYNPSFFGGFLGPDGEPHRWPIPILYDYPFADASNGGVLTHHYQYLDGDTAYGDTHTDMTVQVLDDELVFVPHGHSAQYSNLPETGDTTYSFPQWCTWSDSGPQIVYPVAFSAATTHKLCTYATLLTTGGKTSQVWRYHASNPARVMFSQRDDTTKVFTTVQVNGNVSTRRNYVGPQLLLPDGRRLLTGFFTNDDNNNRVDHWAIIGPRATEDITLNTNWHDMTGQALDGVSGRPLLGSFTFANSPTFHMLGDNNSFFPTFPANGAGMDLPFMCTPMLVSGHWDGVAAVVQISDANGDSSRSVTNSSGTTSPPFDRTEIRRWTYNSTTPSLTARDTFDISDIVATLNPGTWPQETSLDTAEAQRLETMQVGPNQLLVFIVDPENVAIGSNLSINAGVSGFTIRAALFYKMNAADPTQYVAFASEVFSIPTDNSEGYGVYPQAVGTPNDGSKSVLLNIIGGDWLAQGWGNRIVKAVDLTTMINNALATVTPPRAKSIFGSPIFSE